MFFYNFGNIMNILTYFILGPDQTCVGSSFHFCVFQSIKSICGTAGSCADYDGDGDRPYCWIADFYDHLFYQFLYRLK